MPVSYEITLPKLPARPEDSHKGSFGSVLIVAGSRGMSGAAAWDGRWVVVLCPVPEDQRAKRHQLRRRLEFAGFGFLSAGVAVTQAIASGSARPWR